MALESLEGLDGFIGTFDNETYLFDFDDEDWRLLTTFITSSSNDTEFSDDRNLRRSFIVALAYSLIVFVSLFGNILVCYVIVSHKKLRTVTNLFIANLAVSDLLMTVLNIPFNLVRILADNWPFGTLMCQMVPHVQVTSVYVSALTMTCIALDRYQVIINPMKPRLQFVHGVIIVLCIWTLSVAAALPYALYNELVDIFTWRWLARCQVRFPAPALEYRKWLTIITFITQYVIPMTVSGLAYIAITNKVWKRSTLGAVTQAQMTSQNQAKRKTIQMLILVVVIFAVCWLPLNLYHVVSDVLSDANSNRHNSTLFFICHWWAMSSVCYNPFVYCWLNEHYRTGAKRWLSCLLSCGKRRGHGGHGAEFSFVSRRGGDSTPHTGSLIVRPESYRKRAEKQDVKVRDPGPQFREEQNIMPRVNPTNHFTEIRSYYAPEHDTEGRHLWSTRRANAAGAPATVILVSQAADMKPHY